MILFIKFEWIIIYNQQRKKVCLNFFDQLSCKKFDIMNTPFSLHLAEEQKSGIQKINFNKILFIIYYYIEFFRKN